MSKQFLLIHFNQFELFCFVVYLYKLKAICKLCFQLQGGTKQHNGFVRWTTVPQKHSPKNPLKKSSASHSAMASSSAMSSTKSTLVLLWRSAFHSLKMIYIYIIYTMTNIMLHSFSTCLHECQLDFSSLILKLVSSSFSSLFSLLLNFWKVVENPIIPIQSIEAAAQSAIQYFENMRNFLEAVKNMKLLTFEASDLEKVTYHAFLIC